MQWIFFTLQVLSATAQFKDKIVLTPLPAGQLQPPMLQSSKLHSLKLRKTDSIKQEDKKSSGTQDKKSVDRNGSSPGFYALNIGILMTKTHTGLDQDEAQWKIRPLSTTFEVGANEEIAVEIGLFLLEQQYQVSHMNYRLQQEVKRFFVPLNVKIWLWSFLGISAGPYVAFAGSRVTSDKLNFILDSKNLKTPAEDFVEFGFNAAVVFNIPITSNSSIFLEPRYYAPYTDVQLEKINSLFVLCGLRYEL